MSARPFLILMVLDGFGCRKEKEWNAIAQASTPVFDFLFREYPSTRLEASGLHVGLPDGQMGNSEVGHLNMGAGWTVDQDIVRISKAIERGDLMKNPSLVETFNRLKTNRRALHLVGLLSEGGVHSLQSHLHGLIDVAIANGMDRYEGQPSIYVHAVLDGRDTPPRSAVENLIRLQGFLSERPQAHLSTVIGRYFTMDRDRRWERIQVAYDLMTLGLGTETSNPIAIVERYYEAGTNDEFMQPIAVQMNDGSHRGKIQDGDAILFVNFRSDRMRQIVTAFRDPLFDGFERSVHPRVDLLSLVRYREDFDFPVMFPRLEVRNHLGEVFAAHGLRQLRIAETEKFAHVTFFFSGGSDQISTGEEHVLIPSPKVATYDLKPEMSLVELTERVVTEINSRNHDVVILNIANPDMVGHTGVMGAAVTAVEATDRAVGKILDAVAGIDGVALITADHGNCETMFDPSTGQPHTAHTTNPVPLILADRRKLFRLRDGGALANVAPTILELLGLPRPKEMAAESLLIPTEPG